MTKFPTYERSVEVSLVCYAMLCGLPQIAMSHLTALFEGLHGLLVNEAVPWVVGILSQKPYGEAEQ